MKNTLALITLFGILLINIPYVAFSQDNTDTNVTEEIMENSTQENQIIEEDIAVEESKSFHQVIKQKFIEGGPGFMVIVLFTETMHSDEIKVVRIINSIDIPSMPTL